MSTIKINLVAVVALGILTAQCMPMADGFTLNPASGRVIRLHNDFGGLITAYLARFRQARDNGDRVVIDGACVAACTLAVAILPPGRVCVTPQAVLGFQAAWKPAPGMTGIARPSDKIPSDTATQALMDTYPPVLQQWIKRHGGLTPKLILLSGKELTAIVPKCSGSA
jgi:hypothetical protein